MMPSGCVDKRYAERNLKCAAGGKPGHNAELPFDYGLGTNIMSVAVVTGDRNIAVHVPVGR